MNEFVNIVVCRHPETKNGHITPTGGMQAIKLSHYLKEKGLFPERIFHSGADRANQAAGIMAIATDPYNISPEKNEAFHPMNHLREMVKDPKFIQEMQAKKTNLTIKQALDQYSYCALLRRKLRSALAALGDSLARRRERIAWVVSHGEFAETAVGEKIIDLVPYGIEHCDFVLYQISTEKGKIINSQYKSFSEISQ